MTDLSPTEKVLRSCLTGRLTLALTFALYFAAFTKAGDDDIDNI